MSSFFTIPGSQKKRKRPQGSETPKKRVALPKKQRNPISSPATRPRPTKTPANRDESISGSDSEDDDGIHKKQEVLGEVDASESEGEGETAAEKRLRLAERYLQNIRQEVDDGGFDAEEIDRDLIAERLQEDVAEAKGKVYRNLASELAYERTSHSFFRADCDAPTSVAIHAPYAYIATKDRRIQKWRIRELPQNQYPQTTRRKPKRQAPPRKVPELVSHLQGSFKKLHEKDYKRHTKEILAIAVSSDGKFLVTGGEDKRMIVYNAETLEPLKVFTQHRGAVTGVAFRRGTHQLYSCSRDRTVKVWSLDELMYVETLFGHGDEVVDVDALAQERCVSVGSRDRTARLWRVADETQLVFRGGGLDKKAAGSIDTGTLPVENCLDRIAMIDDELFVTGGDSGSLTLWNITKKKPVSTVYLAHGLDPPPEPSTLSADKDLKKLKLPPPRPRWITALKSVPYSDLVLSGSWDGYLRAWRLSEDKRQLLPVGVLNGKETTQKKPDGLPNGKLHTQGDPEAPWLINGVINDLAFFERGEKGKDGLSVIAAIGKEHRFGRWKFPKAKKNGAIVFEVPRAQTQPLANGVNGHDSTGDNQHSEM